MNKLYFLTLVTVILSFYITYLQHNMYRINSNDIIENMAKSRKHQKMSQKKNI